MKNETVSLEVAIEVVLRNGPTFETIAGLCKMAVEASEAQQEPVAVVDDAGVIVVCSYKYKPGDKLYTSPPTLSLAQRQARSADTWVGLTDEQIDALWLQHDFIRAPDRKRQAFARAIEAKLREKNSD